jgi:hypothetical protein
MHQQMGGDPMDSSDSAHAQQAAMAANGGDDLGKLCLISYPLLVAVVVHRIAVYCVSPMLPSWVHMQSLILPHLHTQCTHVHALTENLPASKRIHQLIIQARVDDVLTVLQQIEDDAKAQVSHWATSIIVCEHTDRHIRPLTCPDCCMCQELNISHVHDHHVLHTLLS